MQPPTFTTKRSIVYVDGFNLYYGALRGTPHKWLNLEKYFHLLRPNDSIQKIRYFTALVIGSSSARQEAYLKALGTLPLVEVILGKFKSKQIECTSPQCPVPSPRYFSSYEEKRTDVNIALCMLNDAHQNLCDRLILVSGDSDLVPAIGMVKTQYPEKEIVVYVPARSRIRGAAVELRSIADKDKSLPLNMLDAAQFPGRITDGLGIAIDKPSAW